MRRLTSALLLVSAVLLMAGVPFPSAYGQSPPRAAPSDAAPPPDTSAAQADTAEAVAPPPPAPFVAPTGVVARDTKGDGGGSITVTWIGVPGAASYRIERSEPGGEFVKVDVAAGAAVKFMDEGTTDGTPYRYRVVAVGPQGEEGVSQPSAEARSSVQWFNSYLTGVLISVLGLVVVVLYYINRARSGKHLFIRRIAGLEAVDEAVGRATEMGRPVLYLCGSGYMSDISTIASVNVLGEIAKKTAQYGTRVSVPNCDPIVYTVAREVVRGAYIEAGHPDAFDQSSVYFLVENRLAFSAAVCGIMTRERPATNFLMGYYGGESLILAETGATTGAIQIAGTDATIQLPFFVVACDYTLMGEELYAASAYLSREPLMLGALKGQDAGKLVILVFLIVGTILSLAGVPVGNLLITSAH